jgi:hypothetical protein
MSARLIKVYDRIEQENASFKRRGPAEGVSDLDRRRDVMLYERLGDITLFLVQLLDEHQ